MREKALLVLISIVDALEELNPLYIAHFNIAIKGINQLRVESRTIDGVINEVVMKISPKDFSNIKPYILETKRRCLFFTRKDSSFEQTTVATWSKIAIINDVTTEGLRRAYLKR